MKLSINGECQIHPGFYQFMNQDVLPLTNVDPDQFWQGLTQLVMDLSPKNQRFLAIRDEMQQKIDAFHKVHRSFTSEQYQLFLKEIGYLLEEGEDFTIDTDHVDDEIARIAGPQLVVPLKNARFALNAVNARWGSLYDALYGTDVISQIEAGIQPGKKYNPARGKRVIHYVKDFLDRIFPLHEGSHHDVENYTVYFQNLLACFPDGRQTGLQTPGQFVAAGNTHQEPTFIILRNNGLHVKLVINHAGQIGKQDISGLDDILLESAITTIVDLEDSIAAVDAEDKIDAYRNWLGLVTGSLSATFEKDGKTLTRRMASDKTYTGKDGEEYTLRGRSLLMIRHVGHLMTSDLITLPNGQEAPEGIIDAVVTALISSIELTNPQVCQVTNSRTGSIYVVKPKMHGPDEVAFSCEIFSRVEQMLGLAANTLKIGIMDEERRTSLNLKACIRQARSRVVFINTGFLDRTGDEIHTSMHAGAFLPKGEIKNQPWLNAYERHNVAVGLACGFSGRAQIGKGMWAMPDEMAQMMTQKIAHPQSGATTAWVPSPTAATLHALHYHYVDVSQHQQDHHEDREHLRAQMCRIPLMPTDTQLSGQDIERELENNIQGILGYVVRWIEMGVGCSKVPDIHDIALMEDRATLRISSQHVANWLMHKVCTPEQVETIMARMAEVVDQQNQDSPGYVAMTPDLERSTAYQAARALIFEGLVQPNGYTDPLLHQYRKQAKHQATELINKQ